MGRIAAWICIAAIGVSVPPRYVEAQQLPAPTIGLLDSSAATAPKLSAFYEGLKIEGFVRNQNVTVKYHAAESDYTRLPDLAADLVNRRVTLITALGAPAALAAKSATTEIPIVFAVSPSPIQIGLVVSLNHPGSNMTGVTSMAIGRERKRLELLHALIPTASVIGFLINPQNPNADAYINDTLAAAQNFGVQIKLLRTSMTSTLSTVFDELAQSRAGGVVVADDELFLSVSAELASLATRYRIPAIFEGAAFATAGGLMSYGAKFAELYHQAGAYSGLVLAGAAPAELPIYQSTGIEMIINLRTAKTLGIAVPQAIIDHATALIK